MCNREYSNPGGYSGPSTDSAASYQPVNNVPILPVITSTCGLSTCLQWAHTVLLTLEVYGHMSTVTFKQRKEYLKEFPTQVLTIDNEEKTAKTTLVFSLFGKVNRHVSFDI